MPDRKILHICDRSPVQPGGLFVKPGKSVHRSDEMILTFAKCKSKPGKVTHQPGRMIGEVGEVIAKPDRACVSRVEFVEDTANLHREIARLRFDFAARAIEIMAR